MLVVYLKTKCKTISIVNTYWLTLSSDDEEDSNALQNKYIRLTKNVRMQGDPIDYIRGAIEEKLDKNKEKEIPTILMGDFNAHWDGKGVTYEDLAVWADRCCLINQIETLSKANDVNIENFIRGEHPSQIDHILTSNEEELALAGFGCATGAV